MKRFARGILTVLLCVVGSSACDEDPSGPSVSGEYALVAVAGQRLPYTWDTSECDLTFEYGTLTFFPAAEGFDPRWNMDTWVPYTCAGGQTGHAISWTGTGYWRQAGDTVYIQPHGSTGEPLPLVARGDSLHLAATDLRLSMTWAR